MVIARKCGKTPFVAAIILAEVVLWRAWHASVVLVQRLRAGGSDVPSHQRDARGEPGVGEGHAEEHQGYVFGNPRQKKKRRKFSAQNKGSIRKISAKTGAKDGKNIKVGAVDEVHELKDNTSIMPIRQALSTQDEPLYFEITTEGFIDNGYLDERLREARQVLRGELYRPRWLIWLYTQDSEAEIWQDERTWVKSNPDLGVIKKWSFLRQMVEEAKTNSATRAFVLAKDFNIKQAGGAAWLQDAGESSILRRLT